MYSHEIALLHTDNLKFMATIPDKFYDLGIVDPQTGQGEGKKHASRNITITQKNGNKLNIARTHRIKEWDNSPPPAKIL